MVFGFITDTLKEIGNMKFRKVYNKYDIFR